MLYLQNYKASTILKGLAKVCAIYAKQGFKVKCTLMDGKFKPLQDNLMELGINLNVTAANKHVLHVERQIRVIKEHVHAIKHLLLFQAIPLLMLIKMVYMAIKWINAFPPKGGISNIWGWVLN